MLRFVPDLQPASTFLMVIAVLVLIGATFAGLSPNGGQGVPTAFATEDPSTLAFASPEASPVATISDSGNLCVGQPAGKSDDELRQMSIEDWPDPSYRFPWRADPEVEQAITDTYVGMLQCSVVLDFDEDYELPDERWTYYSDRARFVLLGDDLSAEQRAGIDAFNYIDYIDRKTSILQNLPLPINAAPFYLTIPTTNPPAPDWDNPFADTAVYQLGDGRFGMVIGSITLAALQDPSKQTENDWLSFVAFVEVNGHYYVDENIHVIPRKWEGGTPIATEGADSCTGLTTFRG